MSAPKRGLKNIRTMSDSTAATGAPHRVFLRMALLTLQKGLREQERRAIKARLVDLDSYLAGVEEELQPLLASVADAVAARKKDEKPALSRDAPPAVPAGDESLPGGDEAPGFGIRY
ncbi:MAG: hypothetical protein HYV63_02130 [Candidatus Schekmanbacteria bacterium]|nr:hypothetical protein [Candidatus Schekmanbacteria bacterium]